MSTEVIQISLYCPRGHRLKDYTGFNLKNNFLLKIETLRAKAEN